MKFESQSTITGVMILANDHYLKWRRIHHPALHSLDGHTSNAAWDTVDRITGVGTDGNGEAVDLK